MLDALRDQWKDCLPAGEALLLQLRAYCRCCVIEATSNTRENLLGQETVSMYLKALVEALASDGYNQSGLRFPLA